MKKSFILIAAVALGACTFDQPVQPASNVVVSKPIIVDEQALLAAEYAYDVVGAYLEVLPMNREQAIYYKNLENKAFAYLLQARKFQKLGQLLEYRQAIKSALDTLKLIRN